MSVGDKYTKKIYREFLDWIKNIRLSEEFIPTTSFNLIPLLISGFLEGNREQGKIISSYKHIGISYDLYSPEALRYIETYGAARVRYIDQTIRETIQEISKSGILEGLTMREQRDLIIKHVGLLPAQFNKLQNLRRELFRLGNPPDRVESIIEKNRERMIKYRAMTIALTEGHTAANEGLREANREAVRRGILNPSTDIRIWITAPDERRCPFCANLDGARAELPDGLFKNSIIGPPLHPRCRCTEGIVRK